MSSVPAGWNSLKPIELYNELQKSICPNATKDAIRNTTIWFAKTHMHDEFRTMGYDDRHIAMFAKYRVYTLPPLDWQAIHDRWRQIQAKPPSNAGSWIRSDQIEEGKKEFLMHLLLWHRCQRDSYSIWSHLQNESRKQQMDGEERCWSPRDLELEMIFCSYYGLDFLRLGLP